MVIAVIGAGPSGLVAAKELLEAGFSVVVFEASSTIGGKFANLYDGGKLTSSSLISEFSSYPYMKKHKFWTFPEFTEYLTGFAKTYGVMDRILFSHRVVEVKRMDGKGKWRVTAQMQPTEGAMRGQVKKDFFCSNVVVSCSFSGDPLFPDFKNVDKFEGRIMHSAELTKGDSFAPLRNKRVCLIGLGESGSDLVLSTARVASKTACCARSGPGYIIPRHEFNEPADTDTTRIYHSLPRHIAQRGPTVYLKRWIERMTLSWRYQSTSKTSCAPKHCGDTTRCYASKVMADGTDPMEAEYFALARKGGDCRCPCVRCEAVMDQRADVRELCAQVNFENDYTPFDRFGTKNSGFLVARCDYGMMYKQMRVKQLTRTGVVFDDGSEFDCDVILCATGYIPALPFMKKFHPELEKYATNLDALYRRMFSLEHGSEVVFIGYTRPAIGSVFPLAELQARYLALVLTGKRALPPAAEQKLVIANDRRILDKTFPHDSPATRISLCDFLPALNNYAEMIGCFPPLWKLFFTRPLLWYQVMGKPLNASQYRMTGPGAYSWDKVAERIALFPRAPWYIQIIEFITCLFCYFLSFFSARWNTL